jgi:hypothetical protein|tara:strand:- start:2627 stop:2809 length:183 start_codon:yes stop_codon:yes gene_type:complete
LGIYKQVEGQNGYPFAVGAVPNELVSSAIQNIHEEQEQLLQNLREDRQRAGNVLGFQLSG